MDKLKQIFSAITEQHSVPLRVGSRCEAKTYYRVEDLKPRDLEVCAEYVAERTLDISSPEYPEILVTLRGSFTGFAEILASHLKVGDEPPEVINLGNVSLANGLSSALKGRTVLLVNDVITTARSCLEAHTRLTMAGAVVPCWAALIDRTFGPGPVPVVAAFTGEPVTLLERLA